MKQAKAVWTIHNAVQVINLISIMEGPANHRRVRDKLRTRMFEIWPDLEAGRVPGDLKATQSIILSSAEMTCMLDGLLRLVRKPEANGVDYRTCMQTAKLVKISKEFDKQCGLEDIKDYDGEIDGDPFEADESDEEVSEEKMKEGDGG